MVSSSVQAGDCWQMNSRSCALTQGLAGEEVPQGLILVESLAPTLDGYPSAASEKRMRFLSKKRNKPPGSRFSRKKD
jgi:hypothetical protein